MTVDKNSLKEVEKKLKSYPMLQKKIESIRKRLEIINHGLTNVKTFKLDNIRCGSNDYKIEKLLDEKTKLINELNYLEVEKKLIVEMVNILDGIEREIIIEFYFKNLHISKIAEQLSYSESQIRRVKTNAITNLKGILN